MVAKKVSVPSVSIKYCADFKPKLQLPGKITAQQNETYISSEKTTTKVAIQLDVPQHINLSRPATLKLDNNYNNNYSQ